MLFRKIIDKVYTTKNFDKKINTSEPSPKIELSDPMKNEISQSPNPELAEELWEKLLFGLIFFKQEGRKPLELIKVLSCLISSVIFWKKRKGYNGYLNYIASFFNRII